MNVQYQLEPLPLREAIEAEAWRREANWGWDRHYVALSRYSEQLARYFAPFDPAQVKVFLYDDFLQKPLELYREACRHIAVTDQFVPDMSKRGMVTSRPRNLTLDRWLHWPNPVRARLQRHLPDRLFSRVVGRLERRNRAPVPPLSKELRQELSGLFRHDVERLETLLVAPFPGSPRQAEGQHETPPRRAGTETRAALRIPGSGSRSG